MPKGSQALLLDSFPNATAAFSLRKLSTNYNGNCIRVRRSSDNAEQDIGFSGGLLDINTLLSFVGVENAFVTTWYDQSGNNRNATQTTASRQCRVVMNGDVVLLNGKPCLDTISPNVFRFYNINYSTLRPLPISIISVHKVDELPTNNFNNITFHIGGTNTTGGGGRYELRVVGNNTYGVQRRNTSGVITSTEILNALTYVVQAGYFKTTNVQQRINGNDSTLSNYSGTAFNTSSNFVIVNANGGSDNFHSAKRVQEVIIYEQDLFSNRIDIESNINSHYNIY
jgi:hypothetical protein